MIFSLLFTYFICLNLVYSAPRTVTDDLEISIIHLNDFHARFEEVSKDGSTCKESECIGGFSRVYTAVKELLRDRPNAVFLNAGDNFQGTLWYNLYRWNVTQHFLNKLPTDAYTLGNHEFDQKLAGLIPFIKSLNAPTLVANINDTLEPQFQGLYQKSTIITRAGRKIGIIGVIAKNTKELSSPEKLIFTDEAEAINEEAAKLIHQEGCKIIIVLSHSGFDVDKEIAQKLIPHVNLIVGGHSHTLLYNGTPPSLEKPQDLYPTVINREGRNILIVQASAYTKYLGNLTVKFNDNGDILEWEGNPIYLDANIPQDPEINDEIAVWKKSVDEYSNRKIGSTNVILSKKECYAGECNLGNFLTDAMVDYFVSKAEPNSWTYASIAITNSGGIRAPLPIGNITYGDLVTVAPFESRIDVGELTGTEIKEFLEYSISDKHFKMDHWQFLQLSGMKVVFNTSHPDGSRVTSLKIKCRECSIPHFETYKPNSLYRILIPSFVANGGDGYIMIKENLKNRQSGPLDIDVFEKYLSKMSPVTTGLEGRITIF